MLARRRLPALSLTIAAALAFAATPAAHAKPNNGANKPPAKKCMVLGGIPVAPGGSVKFNKDTVQVGDTTFSAHEEASCSKNGKTYCERSYVDGKAVGTPRCQAVRQ